jgi:hypothetical protein
MALSDQYITKNVNAHNAPGSGDTKRFGFRWTLVLQERSLKEGRGLNATFLLTWFLLQSG